MTAEKFGIVAGLVATGAFSYIPGLDVWYEKQSGQVKSLVMLAANFISAVAIFVFSCYSPYKSVPCTEAGAWELARLFGLAAVANYVSHGFTKKLRTKRFFQKVEACEHAVYDPLSATAKADFR